MDEYVRKVPEPMGSILVRLEELVRERFPDVVVRHPGKVDVEGWLEFGLPGPGEGGAAFAGVRFRRDRSAALTILLAAAPARDPEQWVHPNVAKAARLPHAFGLPRPFSRDVSDANWAYTLDLIGQSRSAVLEAGDSR